MAEHEYYEELITAALDGELTPEESLKLSAHLESCPRCRTFAQAMGAVAGAGAEQLPDPPEDFTRRVMDAVRAQTPGKKKKSVLPFPARLAALAAAAALVLWAGVSALGNLGDKNPSSSSDTVSISNGAPSPIIRSADTSGAAGGEEEASEEVAPAEGLDGGMSAPAALESSFRLYAGEDTGAEPVLESANGEFLAALLTGDEPAAVPDRGADYTLVYSDGDGGERTVRLWESDGTVVVETEDGAARAVSAQSLAEILAAGD